LAAMMLCEIPYAVLVAVAYFIPWYFMTNFDVGGSTAACQQFAVVVMLELFSPWLGILIASASPTLTAVNVVNPFIFGVELAVTGR